MFSDMLESHARLGCTCLNAPGNFTVSSWPFISVDIFAIRNVKMAPRPWKLDGFCFLNVKMTSEKGIAFLLRIKHVSESRGIDIVYALCACFSHGAFSLCIH